MRQLSKCRCSWVLTLKYTFICVYWWTRQRIHNTLIAVDRYLRLMGDKTIPDSAEPRLESFYPPWVAGIDLPHQGVVDSYNPILSTSWLLIFWRHKEPGHQQAWYWPRSSDTPISAWEGYFFSWYIFIYLVLSSYPVLSITIDITDLYEFLRLLIYIMKNDYTIFWARLLFISLQGTSEGNIYICNILSQI